jgi:hypothetical protein
MKALTWNAVCRRRLARHHLLKPAPATQLVEFVRAVCGLRAQIITAAELALGARMADVTQQVVRDELWQRRRLFKTYGPRETLRLLPQYDSYVLGCGPRDRSVPDAARARVRTWTRALRGSGWASGSAAGWGRLREVGAPTARQTHPTARGAVCLAHRASAPSARSGGGPHRRILGGRGRGLGGRPRLSQRRGSTGQRRSHLNDLRKLSTTPANSSGCSLNGK